LFQFLLTVCQDFKSTVKLVQKLETKTVIATGQKYYFIRFLFDTFFSVFAKPFL